MDPFELASRKEDSSVAQAMSMKSSSDMIAQLTTPTNMTLAYEQARPLVMSRLAFPKAPQIFGVQKKKIKK